MQAKIHPDLVPLARDLAGLTPDPRNARKHNERNVREVMDSYKEHGQLKPIVVQRETDAGIQYVVRAGNGQCEAARRLGWTHIACTVVDMKDREAIAYALRDNRTAELAEWSDEELVWNLDYLNAHGMPASEVGWEPKERQALMPDPYAGRGDANGKLIEKFGVPPFSIFDARQGYWQARKRAWIDTGIKSEVGREHLGSTVVASMEPSGTPGINRGPDSGGSIFDPVLCEIAVRWFSPAGGLVLDPFSGGSVRGWVATKLGRKYVGIDLRPEQVKANQEQWRAERHPEAEPVWIAGDSCDIDQHAAGAQADLVFSCPPYADLEVYSDDPRDLSNMDYDTFRNVYRTIITKSCALLKPNRFAVWVVGEVRGPAGDYRNFLGDTIDAFIDAGLHYYNEAVLLTSVGSMPVRAGRQFNHGRKLCKGHQNVLVFYKGDPREIRKHFGDVEMGDLPGNEEAN